MTRNRSVGTADGATATVSVPSARSMTSRPGWKSCPNSAVPCGLTAAASAR